MTLPKPISDAIDDYRVKASNRSIALWTNNEAAPTAIEMEKEARAALEAAILAAIQPAPVEPPTDAEVEAWEREVLSLSIDAGYTPAPTTQSDVGTENEAFVVHRGELESGLALMRRARSTDALAKLRERVQKEMEINHRNPMRCTSLEIQDDCLRAVLDWIDEAQQEAKR